MLADKRLVDKPQFWTDLDNLENRSDAAVEALIKKYAPEVKEVSGKVTLKVGSLNISKSAQKEFAKLNPANQRHYDEFTRVINEEGVNGLRDQQGKWQFKKLQTSKQYPNHYSARLNQGYRVLFTIEDNNVNVLGIGNYIGH